MRLFELLNEVDSNLEKPDWLPDQYWSNIQRYNPGQELEVISAIEDVASSKNLSPAAVAGVINVESRFNPRAGRSFKGATQMGRAVFNDPGNNGRLGGMTFDEYTNSDLPTQIRVYDDYLDNYNFSDRLPDLGNYDPATQAAVLQGFQFAPNARSWQRGFMSGNVSTPTTSAKQANVLGNTSIQDMRDYFNNSLSGSNWDQSSRSLDARMSTSNYSSSIPTTPRFDRSALAPVGTTQYNLRSGTSGEDVSQLQSQLADLGYLSDNSLTGTFDRNTANAVRQFQRNYGLRVDSIAGDQTMSALNQIKRLPDLAPDIPSPSIQSATRPAPKPSTPTSSTPDIPSPIRQSSMPSTPAPTPTPLRTQGPSQI